MSRAKTQTITPVDEYVGKRIRMARVNRGMSQTELGDAIGVTFQQVQKYENGTNRTSSGRLAKIAEATHVSMAYFYHGAPGMPDHKSKSQLILSQEEMTDLMQDRDSANIVRLVLKLPPVVRPAITLILAHMVGEN